MTIEEQALIGAWDLVSLYGRSTEGEIWQVYGKDPQGMLIYTAEGAMTAVLMKQGRTQFSGGSDAPTPEELQEAFFGFDAYCGTYTLEPNQNQVTHHVLASRLPSWVGDDHMRYYDLDGDTLTIRSAPIAARGTEWVVYVVWTRHS
jgi:Lipocalin-like domain